MSKEEIKVSVPANQNTTTQVRIIPVSQNVKKLSLDIIKTPYELSKVKGLKLGNEFKLSVGKIPLDDNNHEVILSIEANAHIEDTKEKVFTVALDYSGIFKLEGNLTPIALEELLIVNCVTMLFPFARQQLAEVTMSGGYPPLMLNMMDFRQMYLQSKQQQ